MRLREKLIFGFQKESVMVVRSHTPSTWKMRHDYLEFEASLGLIVKFYVKTKMIFLKHLLLSYCLFCFVL